MVGSAGAMMLLCGALVYGVGMIGDRRVDPDPPQPSTPVTTASSAEPARSPTLAAPFEPTPGGGMKEYDPPVPSTAAGQTPPAPTSSARPARTPDDVRRKPHVRRSGRCYVYEDGDVRYTYCPGRTHPGRPRR